MKTIRCIVVEDFEPLNNIYVNLLNYEKDISVVGNAFDSCGLFDILKTATADVVLLDIEMKSRMEGLEASKRISVEYPDVKVVILTCHDDEDIILLAFEAGAVDYVLKTASSSQILDAVRSAYNDKSSLNPSVAGVIRKYIVESASMKKSLLYLMNIICTLTTTELEVLKLLLKGMKNGKIAEARNVEMVTVKAHISGILRKFNKHRTSEVLEAIREAGLQEWVGNIKV